MNKISYYFFCLLVLNLNYSGVLSQAIVQTGELKKWHKITLTLDGPASSEAATPNPFLDYRFTIVFSHAPSGKNIKVPGYFAADGDAAETSATFGNKWNVHFAPEEEGLWTYTVSFRTGTEIAIDTVDANGIVLAPYDGITGSIFVGPTDKVGRDFRATGRLNYVGEHFLQYAETGKYFLKGGPDSPENLLGYYEFDNTQVFGGSNTRRTKGFGSYTANGIVYPFYGDTVHHYEVHELDWVAGDPLWQTNKGKGIIGSLNYLVNKDLNCFSFLVMNIDGDGQDTYPYVNYNATYTPQDDRRRFDVSKLAQWEIVLQHATQNGLFMDIKTQETENDQLLDGGQLGVERKLFYRELIARFSHNLGLQWNMGEENDIWTELGDSENLLIKSYIKYFNALDPYNHPITAHSYPGHQDKMYEPLLGSQSNLTGAAIQSNNPSLVHKQSLEWIQASADSNRKWVATSDEIGPASVGVYPDITNNNNNNPNNADEIRKQVLWGNFMAGGAGMQAYFGYSDDHDDLDCEWFGSREIFWNYLGIAKTFMESYPFQEMKNLDALIGNPTFSNDKYCLGKEGEIYLIYLPEGNSTNLDLSAASGSFSVQWFNPRTGGALQSGSVLDVNGGGSTNQIGSPPDSINRDWIAVVQSTGLILPVEDMVFTAKNVKNEVVLDWSNTSNVNSLWYHIRRKFNTGEWKKIGSIPVAADTVSLTEYQYIDSDIQAGSYIYQIMQEDVDGKLRYSKSVELSIGPENEFEVYPNPVNNTLFLSTKNKLSKGLSVKLIDQQGRMVKTQQFFTDNNTQVHSIDISDLSPGIYFIVAWIDQIQHTRRILKLP